MTLKLIELVKDTSLTPKYEFLNFKDFKEKPVNCIKYLTFKTGDNFDSKIAGFAREKAIEMFPSDIEDISESLKFKNYHNIKDFKNYLKGGFLQDSLTLGLGVAGMFNPELLIGIPVVILLGDGGRYLIKKGLDEHLEEQKNYSETRFDLEKANIEVVSVEKATDLVNSKYNNIEDLNNELRLAYSKVA